MTSTIRVHDGNLDGLTAHLGIVMPATRPGTGIAVPRRSWAGEHFVVSFVSGVSLSRLYLSNHRTKYVRRQIIIAAVDPTSPCATQTKSDRHL